MATMLRGELPGRGRTEGAALRLPDGPLGKQVQHESDSDEGDQHRPHLPAVVNAATLTVA